jgi:glycosyltransferase involved in cell wall biosynthesis
MNPSPELSIVLPCYNEAQGLDAILHRFQEAGADRDFELILVDNGSTDNTAEKLAELLPQYPFARSVRVEVNQGYGHGIHTGLRHSRGRFVSWSHADLQTDPADVFRALQELQASDDPKRTIVKGRRYGRRLSERLVSWGMQTVATVLLRTGMHEINAQPKVFDRSLLNLIEHPPVDFNFDVYVLYRAKQACFQIRSIPVKFPPRPYGESNWAATWRSKLRTISRSVKYMCRLGFIGDRGDTAMRVADGQAWPHTHRLSTARRAA